MLQFITVIVVCERSYFISLKSIRNYSKKKKKKPLTTFYNSIVSVYFMTRFFPLKINFIKIRFTAHISNTILMLKKRSKENYNIYKYALLWGISCKQCDSPSTNNKLG